jgi:hypothetical protein
MEFRRTLTPSLKKNLLNRKLFERRQGHLRHSEGPRKDVYLMLACEKNKYSEITRKISDDNVIFISF